MKDFYDWVLFAWAIDFVRCVENMSWIRRLFIRIALGKYAAREYVGLRDHFEKQIEGQTQYGYDLREVDYHEQEWRWFYE